DRVTACACERGGDVSLPQVLHLIGGEVTTGKVASPAGWLAKALAAERDDDRVLDGLFLRTLSRLPTAAERLKVRELRKDTPRHSCSATPVSRLSAGPGSGGTRTRRPGSPACTSSARPASRTPSARAAGSSAGPASGR